MAIFLYDYILTFGMEVDLVWSVSPSLINILFLFQRYIPFLDSFFLVLYVGISSTTMSQKTCLAIMNTVRWMHIIGVTTSELLLTFRTWAVCQDRFRRLSWILIAFMVLCYIPIYLVVSDMFKFTLYSTFFSESVELSSRTCAPIHGSSSLSYLVFVLGSVYQAGLVVLLVVVGYPHYKLRMNRNVAVSSSSDILNIVFGQGILYYLALMFVSTAHVIVVLAAPATFSNLLMPLMRVLHVTLTSRTILDIRQEMRKQTEIYSS
ncbi:hypothetical protein VNI00_006080 [Paramarasmius palmivorus]|uniref:DUF6533 domain-containing protein n=1 Tax=Paramarasmius palmivorus TaxID=297713 RepID=A0AAW0D8Y5_9AGAR